MRLAKKLENINPFNNYLPKAFIDTVRIDKIPTRASTFFEFRSSKFIPKNQYRPRMFDQILRVRHPNSYKTFIVTQENSASNSPVSLEERIYFYEFNHLQEAIGSGYIKFYPNNPDPFYSKKPFVGFTRTIDKFQNQGFGRRRLFTMNAFTRMNYHLPLYSSTTFVIPAAKSIWKRLVKEKKAYSFIDGTQAILIDQRFVMK